MLEALYNISILVETGVLTYMTSKLALDYAWEKTVKVITNNDLWNTPEIQAAMSMLTKEKI